ncbi:MAG: BMP family ABC transporter substrate-binding protein [Clostridiales bacterium]|nr:BMP family ABC transporter substrate-binding protein [Clostridiales bacterium]
MSKNAIKLLFVLVLVLAMIAGCSSPTVEEPVEDKTVVEEPVVEEPVVEEPTITVGLVTDIGGIDDKSFNQGTWEGMVEFAKDFNLAEEQYKYIQSESDADYLPNLATFSDEEMDLIVAPGFLFFDSMTEVAELYPDQKYLLIDSVVDATNVASAVFAEHEGSFLVGVAAALKAQDAGKDTVAFLGGMDFALIQKFEAGFEAGVWAVDPDMTVLVDYAGAFNDAQKGQTIASKFYDQGAYVIYHAAGGTGNGVIKEAKDRVQNGEDVWVIGVDKDQYSDGIYEDGKSVILTSMMKRVDVAAYTVCEDVLNGEFSGDILVFSLANGGVSIPAENPNLKDEWVTTIKEFSDKVVSGEISVPELPVRLK